MGAAYVVGSSPRWEAEGMRVCGPWENLDRGTVPCLPLSPPSLGMFPGQKGLGPAGKEPGFFKAGFVAIGSQVQLGEQ